MSATQQPIGLNLRNPNQTNTGGAAAPAPAAAEPAAEPAAAEPADEPADEPAAPAADEPPMTWDELVAAFPDILPPLQPPMTWDELVAAFPEILNEQQEE